MDLPFTTEQFLNVFRTYNTAIWPLHVAAYLLGLGAVGLSVRPTALSDRLIGAVLAGFWLWMGAVYHLVFFRAINPAATIFGAMFLVQGIAFLFAGTIRHDLRFTGRNDRYGWTGGLFVLYALLLYPVLGAALGHGYPQAPMFGVAPCPTTIFTFGLLLWTRGRVPAWLLLIPGLWALIGVSAALTLGILEDTGLFVAGLVGIGLLLARNRSEPDAAAAPPSVAETG